MKPRDRNTRAMLAAEYVLGTLHGRARARFELWLRSDPTLRREVAHWQEQLQPLADGLPEAAPSDAVWRNIEARIGPRAAPAVTAGPSLWSSLAFWRWSSFSTAALAVAMLAYVVTAPGDRPAEPREAMVVVMADQTSRPQMTVAWMPDAAAKPRLRVRVIGHQTMEPNTSWELWMLPGGNQPPRSLGLITTHETQFVEIPKDLLHAVNRADGMAMSVEPAAGSPTGLPTGPVLYSGKCLKI